MFRCFFFATLGLMSLVLIPGAVAQQPPSWSGIYPHLAVYNDENECGIGAVVPWAGELWMITYAPHKPRGSSDKLYSVSDSLELTIHPESIGGTCANRMIHRESNQLFMGPYVIDRDGNVRVIPFSRMPGRLTGNARHLHDPASKIYCATMEEGIYEVDVNTLAVKTLFPDGHLQGAEREPFQHLPEDLLPGYHGKGLYSAGGLLVYSNNGEQGTAAQTDPTTESGVLATWSGDDNDWQVVRRNQFTEVTGPGGVYGNRQASDPLWAVGWDHKSLILMLLDDGDWHTFRLPKTSHSYDGAHGWNTEWPRIRDIGEKDLLMTMHGQFWRFPRTFSAANSAGIAPRSAYLKVVGDFCRWQDRVVFGCDDCARSEFLNKRPAKGTIAAPQSHSNLWFVEPEDLDRLGPATGNGFVWLNEDVASNHPSDPFLYSGYDRRMLVLSHQGREPAEIDIQVDRAGDGRWESLQVIDVPVRPNKAIPFELPDEAGVWVRLSSKRPLTGMTAQFQMLNRDSRSTEPHEKFTGLATVNDLQITGGLIRARGKDKRSLHFAAIEPAENGPVDVGYYELTPEMKLVRTDDETAHAWLKENATIPAGVLTADKASLIFTDQDGQKYRLPRAQEDRDSNGPLGPVRVDREVATERDLFQCGGTFFELPADNAGGFANIRPLCSHPFRVHDFCSYRGLLVMSGIVRDPARNNPHIISSDDGRTALWVGALDDIWGMGKPVGTGGPWKDTMTTPFAYTEPYLMRNYDRKKLTVTHNHDSDLVLMIQVDLGDGRWRQYDAIAVRSGEPNVVEFPEGFNAHWIRLALSTRTRATATFEYR